MKFRKKPVVIEAVQWNGANLAELRKMHGFDNVHVYFCGELSIKTLEGVHRASIGDYIIKGVNGEFYPCKPDIFEKTYEAVTDGRRKDGLYESLLDGVECAARKTCSVCHGAGAWKDGTHRGGRRKVKYMVAWRSDTILEEIDAEKEKDLIINIAKCDGSYCDLFKKSIAGLEDLKDMVALHDVFAYDSIQDIYIIADHVYTKGDNDD